MKNNLITKVYPILFIAIMMGSMCCLAQQKGNKKTTLGLLTFNALDIEDYREAALLTNTLKQLFVESKKYAPLDRSSFEETSAIDDELEMQKRIEFINGVVAKQGVRKGALFLVGGTLTAVEYQEMKNGLHCKMTFSINITDVATEEIIASKTFKPSPVPPISPDGIDSITSMATRVTLWRNKLNNFIIENTPFYAQIEELERDGKNTNILLKVGEAQGVGKGSRFAIFKVKRYDDGSIRKLEITKFSINDVQGDYSTGKIPKNKVAELKELMEDPDVELICQEVECKFCPGKIIN
ncbi:CsgG/HfaB family protein [Flagellimonas myxillae]|uniref:CsgG/HfaB family protein n=1 Tax=Flagellimonas myxillae TaxID=2942214 RepID=UPI00201F28AA|nr:CsgG/HfaB family protein [Muricauda myxillae]MCL6265061.1 CsgG/HfaB family protein [Muricauda myxillae]